LLPGSGERTPAGPAVYWPELDLLRSLAAALMVLNHVAVRGVEAGVSGSSPVSILAFAGSFAPVMFFFLTGLGSGVQSIGRPGPHGYGYVLKVLVLLAADAMIWVRPGTYLGLDFLGFIGLSMLALEWVRRTRFSGLLAACLAAAVVVARYLVAPLLKQWLAARDEGWLGLVLGTSTVAGVSYPMSPWLAYPLMGYALGRAAAWWGDSAAVRRPAALALLAGLAGLAGGAAWVLSARGAQLFRWGSMSFAYFVASLAALAVGLALVLGAARCRPLTPVVRRVALGGVRSFAVVPLHYALMEMCDFAFGPVVGFGTYARTVSAVLVLSFAGSALVPGVAAALNSPARRRLAWTLVPMAFAIAYLLLAGGKLGAGSGLAVRPFIQLALCTLLATTRTPVVQRAVIPAATVEPASSEIMA
jgi:uncharacterized membrane protein